MFAAGQLSADFTEYVGTMLLGADPVLSGTALGLQSTHFLR